MINSEIGTEIEKTKQNQAQITKIYRKIFYVKIQESCFLKKKKSKQVSYEVLNFKNEVRNQSMKAERFGYGKAK